jgi:two-component system, NarL family, response regulator LiaR
MSLKVFIADDHRLILDGIRQALGEADDIEVVGSTHSGSQIMTLISRTRPDLAVIDINMRGADGLSCLDTMRKRFPDLKIVVLSTVRDPERIQAALRRGAIGYIVKTVDPRDLPSALRQAAEGTVYHSLGMDGDETESAAKATGLTERQIAILRALARGLSNQAISRELWVTEQTVKFHLANIYRALGVANRTEAARYAFEHGLVESFN